MDGNRTHQALRKQRLNGFEDRGTMPDNTGIVALTGDTEADYTKNDTKSVELQLICEAWPTLPETIKAAISTLVAATIDIDP